jgi:Na+/H+ antiporter NhaB
LSFGRDFKDSFDHAPLWYKILVIILCIVLIIIYILVVSPFLIVLSLITKRDTMSAVTDLIVKEIFNPFDIFFGD